MAPKNDAAKADSPSSSNSLSSSDEEGHPDGFEVRFSKTKPSLNSTIDPFSAPQADAEEEDDETCDESGGGDEEGASRDEEYESEDVKTTNPLPKRRYPKLAPVPPSDSATDSDDDSASGSDTSDEAPHALVVCSSIKPLNSKAVDPSLRVRNHALSSLPPPPTMLNDGDPQKKQLFQRRWNLEDEVALLEGLMEYSNVKGAVPTSARDMEDFLDFIQGSIHIQINYTQLYDKVRSLKRRFEKILAHPKNGADPIFSKSREQTLYALSKKVWGIKRNTLVDHDDDDVDASDDNEESRRNSAIKQDLENLNSSHTSIGHDSKDIVRDRSQCPYVLEKVVKMANEYSCGLAIKRSLEMLDGTKAQQLERKLRKQGKTEMTLNARRSDLIKESVKLIIEAVSRAERSTSN